MVLGYTDLQDVFYSTSVIKSNLFSTLHFRVDFTSFSLYDSFTDTVTNMIKIKAVQRPSEGQVLKVKRAHGPGDEMMK